MKKIVIQLRCKCVKEKKCMNYSRLGVHGAEMKNAGP